METLANLLSPLWPGFLPVVIIAGTAFAVVVLHAVIYAVLKRAFRNQSRFSSLLVGRSRRPALLLFAAIAAWSLLPLLAEQPALSDLVRHASVIAFILALGLVARSAVSATGQLLLSRYDVTVSDNLKARSVTTQVKVFEQIAVVVIALIVVAAVLMTFDDVQQIGASLLASAGIAGLVIGVAAQKSLGNVVAGVMIAITQPIRLDDAVVVEGEWGWIEEINLTYVVLRIWDKRRLVIPITYFVDQPFQNWTRSSADILGTVVLHVDYRAPIDALRAEQSRLLTGTPLWDGKVDVLQVIDTTPHTVVIRSLVSAADSPTAWDLRVLIREQLIAFLQREHPEGLPRLRVEDDDRPRAQARPTGRPSGVSDSSLT